MPIKPTAFLAIEGSLTDRLMAGWNKIAADLLPAVWKALEAGNVARAVMLANDLDLSPLLRNTQFIETMSRSALVFGASRVTASVDKIKAQKLPASRDILRSANTLLAKMVVRNVEDEIRRQLLDEIAAYDIARHTSAEMVFKYDPDQPRDRQGQWTDGTPPVNTQGEQDPASHYAVSWVDSAGKGHFKNSLGILREDMPQIKGSDRAEFIAFAASRGVTVTEATAVVRELRATQEEFNPEQVAQMPADTLTIPVITSLDGQVLDGHNRYMRLLRDNPHQKANILRIGLPVMPALDLMFEFPKVGSKTVGQVGASKKYDADQVRDEFGRWAKELSGGEKIAAYVQEQSSSEVDTGLIKEEFRRDTAVLSVVAVSDLEEGSADNNLREEDKEQSFLAMATVPPPLLVRGKQVLDGNHRLRVARARGAKQLLAYVIGDEITKFDPDQPRDTAGKWTDSGRVQPPEGKKGDFLKAEYAKSGHIMKREAGPAQHWMPPFIVTDHGVLLRVRKASFRDLGREAGKRIAEGLARPFTSFKDATQSVAQNSLQLTSSLHTSRVSAFGFTVEAEVTGLTEYAISEQLDNRICPICEITHGKVFDVTDAQSALRDILTADDPDDMKTLQPWPKQDPASVEAFRELSNDELVERNWHLPPYHPLCRGMFVRKNAVPDITNTPSYRAARAIADAALAVNPVVDAGTVDKIKRPKKVKKPLRKTKAKP